jgi:Na+/proline symporter
MLIVQMRSAALTMEVYLRLPYVWSLILFSVVLVVFSALGGRAAISRLSIIQGVIMLIGVTGALIVSLVMVHSLSGMDALMAKQDPNLVTFFGKVPQGLWYNLAFVYLFGLFSSPHVIPSFYGMKNARTARIAFPIGVTISIYWAVVAVLIGLVTRALGYNLTSPDLAFVTFTKSVAPGFIGLLIILCLLAAIFTTLDTLLMAAGTSVVHDIIGRARSEGLEEKQELFYSRIAMVAVGAVAFILSLLEMPLIAILNAFAFGAFIIVLGVPMVMGIFWHKANKEAALFTTAIGPLIYIFWRYVLVRPTGLGEVPGTLIVVVVISVIWSLLKPATNEDYFTAYYQPFLSKKRS